jgi:hypothetical protein
MTLRSTYSPEFAQFDDATLAQHYISAHGQRKALIARAGDGENLDAELDAIDALMFRIDDELCARNLDLPN